MQSIIFSDFGGSVYQFDEAGWFNATGAAAGYGKRPVAWLRMAETRRYLAAMCRRSKVRETHYVKTSRGGDMRISGVAGTWLHPKLAVRFAQWLDIDFAVWCDEQIDVIMRGGQERQSAMWKELQTEIAADAVSLVRASFGSRLMLDRKREKPIYKARIAKLNASLQPSLLQEGV